MSAALDAILADTDAPLEVAIEMDSAKRSDGTAKTWYFSTHDRQTGAAETPANTPFLPFLLGGTVGPLSQGLAEDAVFSGLAASDPGSIVVVQKLLDSSIDQLSQLHDYTFFGRQARVKIGRRADAYASFATLRKPTCKTEPEVELTERGLQARWQLSSALGRLLEENLIVERYVGIPHCARILTTTGTVTATRIAAYDLSRFAIMVRFRTVAGASGGNIALAAKVVSVTTDCNYLIRLLQTSGYVNFVSTAGGASSVNITSSTNYADNAWHMAVFGQDDAVTAYGMVDGSVIGTVTPSGSPNLSVANFLMGNGFGDDVEICDVRIYDRYIPPDEARGLAAVRCDGDDLGIIGLWRFDDNTGGAVNDYSSNNNDATFGGSAGTDYSWQPSDLGEPELAGRPMPVVVGEVLNAQAHLIDANREHYRKNDGNLHSSGSNTTLTVRSRGVVLTNVTDYTVASDGGDGIVDMVNQQDEPVTFDLRNNGTSEETVYASYVAHSLLTNRTRITGGDINQNVDALLVLCPWLAGYRTDVDATAQQALQEILGNAGLGYYEDDAGKLMMNMFLPPVGYGPDGNPCMDFRGGSANGWSFGDIGDCSGSMTIACWVNAALIDQTGYNWGSSEPNMGTLYLVAKPDTSGNYAFYFQAIGANAGKLCFRTAGTTVRSPAGVLEASAFYFVAVVFDSVADTVKFYAAKKGGTLAQVGSTLAHTGTPTTDSNALKIGGGIGAFNWTAMQHAQVWNTTKTLAQLQALMATPPVGNEANLVAYIPMNEGDGAPVEKVNSVTGTATGYALNDTLGPRWAPKLVVNLGEMPSARLSEFRHVAPAAEVLVHYAPNRLPMTSADIATSVTQNNRLDLMRRWKDVWLPNADNRSRFKSARKAELFSAITDRESAQRLARALMTRLGTDRWVGRLSFPPEPGLAASRRAVGLALTDEIGLTGAIPAQLSTPRSFRVALAAPDPLKLSTTIAFWG